MNPPRICIITDEVISPSQGTGALLLRQLGEQGMRNILNVAVVPAPHQDQPSHDWMLWDESYRPWHETERLLRQRRWAQGWQAARSLQLNCRIFDKVADFSPELFWVIVYSPAGIRMAVRLSERFPNVPLYVSFWDLILDYDKEEPKTRHFLRTLCQRAARVDCVSVSLAMHLAKMTGRRPSVGNIFCCEAPPTWKTDYAASPGGLQPVLVGNMWQTSALPMTEWLLAAGRRLCPSVKDAIWYAHPHTLEYVGVATDTLPEGLTYGGYFTGEALQRRLAAADFCILPFSDAGDRNQGVVRYSIPSRISEVMMAGLPVFAIAEDNTALAQYLSQNDIGAVCAPRPRHRLIEAYRAFLENEGERERIGKRARDFAGTQFDLKTYRKGLARLLRGMTSINTFEGDHNG